MPYLNLSAFLRLRLTARRSVQRPNVRLSAAGEGVFRECAGDPQAVFLIFYDSHRRNVSSDCYKKIFNTQKMPKYPR